MEKTCPRCDNTTERFWKDSSRKDGLMVYCTSCSKKYKADHPEIVLRIRANFKLNHPDYYRDYFKNHEYDWKNYSKEYRKRNLKKKNETINLLNTK